MHLQYHESKEVKSKTLSVNEAFTNNINETKSTLIYNFKLREWQVFGLYLFIYKFKKKNMTLLLTDMWDNLSLPTYSCQQ